MAKRPVRASHRSRPTRRRAAVADAPAADAEQQIAASDLSLHELFAQQTRQMLDRADLDEEQKQTILLAMSCPCCGAGGLSFTMKLKR